MASPVAPWHMWGTSRRVTVRGSAIGPIVASTVQLAKVSYRRPDTWRFLIWGRLTGGAAVAGARSVIALVDIMAGVGRSVLDTQTPGPPTATTLAFVRFRWDVAGAVVPGAQVGNVKWTTSASTPPLDDSIATSTQIVEQFVAEDISCRARLFRTGSPEDLIEAEIGTFFAPNAHVRPDWMRDDNQFLGGEIGGS